MQQYIRTIFLVVLSTFGAQQLKAQTTVLDQSLLSLASFNSFTPVSVTGTQTWYNSSLYGAICNGYASGQSFANEDWLISPAMDLSQLNNVKLTFSHTRGNASVVNVGVAEGWYKVFATANYTGNPTTTQWIELTGINQTVPTAWNYVASGDVLIPQAAKSANSRIAFRYISSATQSATWEIKNVKVTGEAPANPNTSTFKITNWNTEWLGCTTFGPTDETLQINNVASAMLAMNSDIYCLQEVINSTAYPSIATLVSLLGSEWEGKILPVSTGDCEQRQAIIYKKAKVQYVSATQLSSGNASQGNSYSYNWSSGRFPSVYNVNLVSGSNLVPLTIVNIHAKSEDADPMSYTRRLGGSEALKTILDGTNYNTKNLLLIGDFNDYLIGTSSTVCNCTVSPYKNFMDSPASYTGITQYLNDAHWNHPLIENIMLSNELAPNYVSNSAAQEVGVPPAISNYYNTTSDHLPVSASFQFSTLANPQYAINKVLVYPNPVHDILTVDTTDPIEKVVITNELGQSIKAGLINKNQIDFSQCATGVYFMQIQSQNSTKTTKVIKQ